jgi:hypothetical protein
MSITPTDATETNSSTALTDSKFAADQIETDCPARLQEIAREITERLAEACDQVREKLYEEEPRKNAEECIELMRLVYDHITAVKHLFDEAEELCDPSGFDLFSQKLRPYFDQFLNEVAPRNDTVWIKVSCSTDR